MAELVVVTGVVEVDVVVLEVTGVVVDVLEVSVLWGAAGLVVVDVPAALDDSTTELTGNVTTDPVELEH
jgi:hypothetical protein